MEYIGVLVAALSGCVSLLAFLRAAITTFYEVRVRRARKRADRLAAEASAEPDGAEGRDRPASSGTERIVRRAEETRREEREARKEEGVQEQRLRDSERRWGWSRVEDWGGGHPVALSLVIGFFFLAVTVLIAANSSSSARGPQLRVIDKVLGDGLGKDEDYASNVLLKLHNDGDRRAILLRLKAIVLRTATLDVCVMQGGSGTPETGRYSVVFPPDVKRGQHIELMLNQELAPDRVDLFRLLFQSPELEGLPSVYEVKVVATYDRGPPLTLGRFLVMTPVTLPPPAWPYWLARQHSAHVQARSPHNDGYDTIACYRRNRQAVGEFSKSPAEMTSLMRRVVAFSAEPFATNRKR